MRILIASPVFLPHVGGVEGMVDCLTRAFLAAGHQVLVATLTGEETAEALPYPVLRRPGPLTLLAAARRSDVVLQNAVSLRLLLPILAARRPCAIVHHNWLPAEGWPVLRRWVLRRGRNIAVSQAIAGHLPVPSRVIPNGYRDARFRDLGREERRYDLCCVARFVSDKGVDLLLSALAMLGEKGLRPRLLLIGDGPERQALAAQAAELCVSAQVTFAAVLAEQDLAAALNDSRILVVPSRFREPFGIVALEGAACGCYVVGADGGGLAEAIGPCGETFARGSAAALCATLARLLTEGLPVREPARVAAHLAAHGEARIAELYLQELQGLAGPGA